MNKQQDALQEIACTLTDMIEDAVRLQDDIRQVRSAIENVTEEVGDEVQSYQEGD